MKQFVIFVVLVSFLGIGLAGCSTMNSMNNTQRGALYGGTLGAIGGAVIGNNLRNKHKYSVRNGAILGAIAGALGGAVIGNEMDHQGGGYGYHQAGNGYGYHY